MKQGILILTLLTLLFVSCRDEGEEMFSGQTIPFSLPIELLLQPEVEAATRVPGDPGTWEKFKYPGYVYIYLVAFGDDFTGGKVCELDRDEDGEGDGNLWPEVLTTGWTQATNSDEVPQTLNDSIYKHTSLSANFILPTGTKSAKIYIAASYMPLTLKKNGVAITKLTAANNEEDVLAITFDADGKDFQNNLQNLYSTPYKYMPAAAPYNGNYYGTVNLKTRSVRMMLYHVAAKVDVKWNVAEDKQDDYYISYIQARQLKQKNCLLFKPTENTWTSADDAANYSVDLVDGDIGQQWLGRQYFYAIPYGSTYNIHLHFLKNGNDKDTYAATGYNLKLTKDMTDFPVFTPWIRADLRFTTDGITTYSADEIEKSLD